jgi:hypothetical protein
MTSRCSRDDALSVSRGARPPKTGQPAVRNPFYQSALSEEAARITASTDPNDESSTKPSANSGPTTQTDLHSTQFTK